MPARRDTVAVRLDDQAAKRVAAAARITRQSRGAFLGNAGDERAHRVLLEWARARHREGSRSFSGLAEETGLPLEEIMLAMGDNEEDGLALFLASARAVARATNDAEFVRTAERAADIVRAASRAPDQT